MSSCLHMCASRDIVNVRSHLALSFAPNLMLPCCLPAAACTIHTQTCAVVAVGVFGATLGAAYQCIVLSAVFGVSLFLLTTFKPYNHEAAHALDAQGLACLMLTAQGALVFSVLAITDPDAAADSAAAAAVSAVGGVVVAINVIFVVSVMWRVLRVVEWDVVAKAAANVGDLVRRSSQRYSRGHRSLPSRSS
jgi:hypothetical protein